MNVISILLLTVSPSHTSPTLAKLVFPEMPKNSIEVKSLIEFEKPSSCLFFILFNAMIVFFKL